MHEHDVLAPLLIVLEGKLDHVDSRHLDSCIKYFDGS